MRTHSKWTSNEGSRGWRAEMFMYGASMFDAGSMLQQVSRSSWTICLFVCFLACLPAYINLLFLIAVHGLLRTWPCVNRSWIFWLCDSDSVFFHSVLLHTSFSSSFLLVTSGILLSGWHPTKQAWFEKNALMLKDDGSIQGSAVERPSEKSGFCSGDCGTGRTPFTQCGSKNRVTDIRGWLSSLKLDSDSFFHVESCVAFSRHLE